MTAHNPLTIDEENTGRSRHFEFGPHSQDSLEVVEFLGEPSGTLLHDDSGWTFVEADFDEVVAIQEDDEFRDDRLAGRDMLVEVIDRRSRVEDVP